MGNKLFKMNKKDLAELSRLHSIYGSIALVSNLVDFMDEKSKDLHPEAITNQFLPIMIEADQKLNEVFFNRVNLVNIG